VLDTPARPRKTRGANNSKGGEIARGAGGKKEESISKRTKWVKTGRESRGKHKSTGLQSYRKPVIVRISEEKRETPLFTSPHKRD